LKLILLLILEKQKDIVLNQIYLHWVSSFFK